MLDFLSPLAFALPYSFSVVATGTVYTFAVTAVDSLGAWVTQSFTLTIQPAP